MEMTGIPQHELRANIISTTKCLTSTDDKSNISNTPLTWDRKVDKKKKKKLVSLKD